MRCSHETERKPTPPDYKFEAIARRKSDADLGGHPQDPAVPETRVAEIGRISRLRLVGAKNYRAGPGPVHPEGQPAFRGRVEMVIRERFQPGPNPNGLGPDGRRKARRPGKAGGRRR